jgi:hypothetical protein
LVFPVGQRDANIVSTAEYCRQRGNELRAIYLNSKSFDIDQKKKELRSILRIDEKLTLKEVFHYSAVGGWDRVALETSEKMLIPLLHLAPMKESLGYVIICNPDGKKGIPLSVIDELKKKGSGIVIVDLSGTGELTSTSSLSFDKTGRLHTLSRAELWLGRTLLGDWVKELDLVTQFLYSNYKAQKVSIDGSKEAGLTGLFLSALDGKAETIILRDCPVSYLFDSRETLNYFSMAIFLPRFLNWGDVSLAAAISGKDIKFINPVTMSGKILDPSGLKEYQTEFDNIRKVSGKKGKTSFINNSLTIFH